MDGHGLLQAVEVPQVAEILLIGASLCMDGLPIPEDFTRLDGRQAAHHAQQAGFSSAIRPHDMKPTTGLHRAIDALEQLASSFAASEVIEGKNRSGCQFVVSTSQVRILSRQSA